MRIRISATPENGNLSSRDLSPEKIDRHPKLRAKESHLFSVKERADAKRGAISFVVVQNFPNRFAENAKDLDSDQSRSFDHSGIPLLDEQLASERSVPVKLKIPEDEETLFS
jgi:hypothetical protein